MSFLRRFHLVFTLAAVGLLTPAAALAQSSDAGFSPSLLALGITGLFAVATLLTGAAALFGQTGISLLIRTETMQVADTQEALRAPNVRAWGVRQIVTGVPLWGALFLGDQALFQVGLAALLLRQALDIVLYLLDGEPKKTIIFWIAAAPSVAAFVSVL